MIHLAGDLLSHFAVGLLFAGTGAYARTWCEHRGWKGFRHKASVGVILVAAETAVIVPIVG